MGELTFEHWLLAVASIGLVMFTLFVIAVTALDARVTMRRLDGPR